MTAHPTSGEFRAERASLPGGKDQRIQFRARETKGLEVFLVGIHGYAKGFDVSNLEEAFALFDQF